ncbi:DUF6270 domain-containing protein [Glutamicibacter ardleyensis]
MTKSLFIYGSCVSRDTASFMTDSGFEIAGYVARQSLVSAFGATGLSGIDLDEYAANLESNFQRSSFVGDANSSLPREIRSNFEDIDCMLVDLVDERGGVWMNERGEVLTNSLELTKSEIIKANQGSFKLLKLGDREHVDEFLKAVQKFEILIKELTLSNKIYFIANYWAEESQEGDHFPFGGSRVDPVRMNNIYAMALAVQKRF